MRTRARFKAGRSLFNPRRFQAAPGPDDGPGSYSQVRHELDTYPGDAEGLTLSLLVFASFCLDLFFDLHVVEFVGVEDLATELTLDKLNVVFTRDDTHLAMLAGGIHDEKSTRRR